MTRLIDRFLVTVDDEEFDVSLSDNDGSFVVAYDGEQYQVTVDKVTRKKFLFKINELSSEVDITRLDGDLEVFIGGREMTVRVEPYGLAELKKRAGDVAGDTAEKIIRAPMPGLVLKSEVNPGQTVDKGTSLVIIEAMKMENVIKSPFAGKVKEIFVTDGQAVDKNDKLVELE